MTHVLRTASVLAALAAAEATAQLPPYDERPPAEPPVYRVRYEADPDGGCMFPVTFTAWVPPDVATLRGVIVHQHGCGEGSCRSGLTGAYDLHWQALAAKHRCALVAPAYEQPETADCQMWCDPRNGSAAAFARGLADLAEASGHPELPRLPWALWGHSGGGHWAGGMVMLHPERVVAAWLRSGVPLLAAEPDRPGITPHELPDAALRVPLVCNLGTREGVTGTDDRFKGVWPANETFFRTVRGRGGLVAVAIDPLSSHDCGNQRYLAIPWLDACLAARLPQTPDGPLESLSADDGFLAPITGGDPVPARTRQGDPLGLGWLPDAAVAAAWKQYVTDTMVADTTPPPAPTAVRVAGGLVTWQATADLESGLRGFIVERDGERVATLPERPENPFGRPVFQNLLYSDTPSQPLVKLEYRDAVATPGNRHVYRIIAINTAGLESQPSAAARE